MTWARRSDDWRAYGDLRRGHSLFVRYANVAGVDAHRLRHVLDEAWRPVFGDDVDLAGLREVAVALVPSEEGEWFLEMGYGQNAAACVAYAVGTWLTGDPQEAVWAGRQVFEAADYAAQHLYAELNLNWLEDRETLLQSPILQHAVSALLEDLASVESGTGWEHLRVHARQGGEAWAKMVP